MTRCRWLAGTSLILALGGCQAVLGIEGWEPRDPDASVGAGGAAGDDGGAGLAGAGGGSGSGAQGGAVATGGSAGTGAAGAGGVTASGGADSGGGTDGGIDGGTDASTEGGGGTCVPTHCVTILDVAAPCDGTCRGTCDGTCSGEDAAGDCAGDCAGNCRGTCIEPTGAACAGTLECDAIADFGDPCSEAGQGACLGRASDRPLLCDGSGWTGLARCPAGQRCDATPGPSAGTCLPVVPECAGGAADDVVCRGMQLLTCGPDLVTAEMGDVCTNHTDICVDGSCRACPENTRNCNMTATDCETDLDDVSTCGTTCDDLKACSAANGTPSCSGGACTMSCDAEYADCGGANDGCETRLTQPVSCGTSCADVTTCTWPTPACVGGACDEPPSCRGLPTTCGPGSDESCCASELVTGGTFLRSYDGVSWMQTDPSHPATVSDFRLDRFEVTVGRFRKFKVAWDAGWRPVDGGGKHTHLNGGNGLVEGSSTTVFEAGWDPSWTVNVNPTDINLDSCWGSNFTSTVDVTDNRPMNCTNWYEAAAFCIWDGGFLPTEAEWNYAAAAGDEQRVYPWSNPASSTTIDCTHAVYTEMSVFCETTFTADVGSRSPKGDGRFGQADLAGNVWEWAFDSGVDYVVPCTDCLSFPTPPSNVIIRGGSAGHVPGNLIASLRSMPPPSTRGTDIGHRCARSP